MNARLICLWNSFELQTVFGIKIDSASWKVLDESSRSFSVKAQKCHEMKFERVDYFTSLFKLAFAYNAGFKTSSFLHTIPKI